MYDLNMKIRIGFGLLWMVSLAQVVSGVQVSPDLKPHWEKQMKAIRAVRLSHSGDCVAVATLDRISLLARSGEELWHWEFSKGNRFMRALNVSVSPQCDWLAVAGDASYRYIWIAHRNGRLIPIRTNATPVGLAISHRGDLLAIGTGAGDVWLFDAGGKMRWRTKLGYCCVNVLNFSADDQVIVSSSWASVGMLSVDGRVQWVAQAPITGMAIARDLKTIVEWYEPNHGTGVCWVELLDRGTRLWLKNAPYDPVSIISPAGDLVIAPVKDNQGPTEEDAACDSESPVPMRLLSRTGEILRTFPGDVRPLAFAPDGKSFLVSAGNFEAWDLDSNVLWVVPVFDPVLHLGWVHFTEDLRTIVEWSEDRIAWFSTPQ